MPREIITVQVGQCGNQIGHRFWDLALREHAACNKKCVYDEALSRWWLQTVPNQLFLLFGRDLDMFLHTSQASSGTSTPKAKSSGTQRWLSAELFVAAWYLCSGNCGKRETEKTVFFCPSLSLNFKLFSCVHGGSPVRQSHIWL